MLQKRLVVHLAWGRPRRTFEARPRLLGAMYSQSYGYVMTYPTSYVYAPQGRPATATNVYSSPKKLPSSQTKHNRSTSGSTLMPK